MDIFAGSPCQVSSIINFPFSPIISVFFPKFLLNEAPIFAVKFSLKIISA